MQYPQLSDATQQHVGCGHPVLHLNKEILKIVLNFSMLISENCDFSRFSIVKAEDLRTAPCLGIIDLYGRLTQLLQNNWEVASTFPNN